MKKKTLRGSSNSSSRRDKKTMKGSLARHLTVKQPPQQHQKKQLGELSSMTLQQQSSSHASSIPLLHPPRFQSLLESESEAEAEESQYPSASSPLDIDIDPNSDDKDLILSQDFFCTPDYLTPEGQFIANSLDFNMENIPCPRSPEKLRTVKSKRQRQEGSILSGHEQIVDLADDTCGTDEKDRKNEIGPESQKNHSYVSQSAVALRCRVMPPPCIKNPYLKDASEMDMDPFSNRRLKCAGIFPTTLDGDGLSRYRTDFHEVEQIGNGNFSRVFKVLKRIDGCLYAVKKTTRLLHHDTERRKALMEVQALAALGYHENLVGYFSSWFENEQLFIQMELCDHSLSISKSSRLLSEGDVLELLHQIAKALQFIHERGIAHLDVKPDNIYVKNGVYKLGDFGCAILLDRSLPIEEGDARYMPREILNDNYDHLDKVDIFSLGASIYELIRGSPLPESGPLSLNLKEGKVPLLPGRSVQFQNLIKAMMDPDPVQRPSAKELSGYPICLSGRRILKSM